MSTRPLQIAVGLAFFALVLGVSPASAGKPECKAINQSQDATYSSKHHTDPLGTAIAEAQPGDTIKVIGTCHGNFGIDKDLTLTGRKSAHHEDTIDGDGSGEVLFNTANGIDWIVRNLTVTGGTTGIHNANATLSVTSAHVTGNTGSGILNGGVTTVEGSFVSENDSDSGGGIFNGGALTINNSAVTNNTAADMGGGIWSRFPFTVSNSVIQGNTAGAHGGGILAGTGADILNTVIDGNTAGLDGGGIHNVDLADTDLTNSIVRNNVASRGGGIFTSAAFAPLALTDSVVTANTATVSGGGIFCSGGATIALHGTSIVFGNDPDDVSGCSP